MSGDARSPIARPLRALDAWFYAAAPPERLALLRIALGIYALVYLLTRAAHLNRVVSYPAEAFAPVGPVSLLALPLSNLWVYALYVACVISGAAFTLGARYHVSGPAFALLLLWVTSYRNSWGMIFHTDNLLVLHVLLLAAAPAADALTLGRGATPREPRRYGWAIRSMALVCVATYVAAGVAKLHNSGLSWALGAALREQIAYDALRKLALGSFYSPLTDWLLPQAWIFPVLSVFTLAVELLAPLALLGPRSALIWAASAWLFHLGVVASMLIVFPYPLSGCAFLCLFPLERVLEYQRVRALVERWRGSLDLRRGRH
jgi:hypothetical protein